ncbi:MAG: condensation domain-containing protein [Bacillota bacterium]
MGNQLYPLNIGQRLIAYAALLHPGTPVSNIGGLLLLEDELDFDLMEKAIKLCVQRNDSLRLRMVKKKKKFPATSVLFKDVMEQYALEDPPVNVGFLDYSDKSMAELDAALLEMNARPIDIFNEPVFEFTMVKAGDGRQGVFTKIDHIATDAWMSMMHAKEVMEVYYALKKGKELPAAAYPFLPSIEAEQAYTKSDQYQADRDFWMSKFTTKPHKTFIYGGKKYPKSKTGKSERYEVRLSPDLCADINTFCRENAVSPMVLFNQLMAIYLSTVTGSPDVSFNTPAMLRSTLKEKRTCGPHVNSFLIRTQIDETRTLLEACKQMHSEHMSMLRHVRYPTLHLTMEILRKYFMRALADTLLSFQVARIQTTEDVPFETKWYPSGYYASPFTLNVTDMDNTGALFLQYEYQTGHFTGEMAEKIHRSLLALLEKSVHEPGIHIRNLYRI